LRQYPVVEQNENPHDNFPPPEAQPPQPPPRPGFGQKLKKTLGPIGAGIVALFAKFKIALVFIVKYGWLVLKTGGTMLLSIWVYAMFWGVWFAVGFVVLIFVHECGHLLAAKRFGLKVGAPVFIPFLGALIALKEAPRNAWVESVVGIGGPVLGSAGALACEGLYLATGSLMFRGLAHTGFLLNLFNLMPIGVLDGGRIVSALSPWLWLVGLAVLLFLTITQFNFILLLILLMSLPRLFSLFRPKTDDQLRYYEVTPQQRVVMSVAYFGLIAALVVGMRMTLIPQELLQRRGDKVVIRVPDDFHAGKFSGHRLAPHIDATVDVRGVGLAASDPISPASADGRGRRGGSGANQTMLPRANLGCLQILRARLAFDQDQSLAADARGGNLPGDL
jgi:Zn-dependent protease